MTYHTNHCWCNASCWDNKPFDGEVMVYFGKTLENDLLDKNNIEIEDLDFKSIELLENKEVFNKTAYEEKLHIYQDEDEEINKRNLEMLRRIETRQVKTLTSQTIQWLNNNIKDDIDGKKMWAIPNDESLSNYGYDIIIWFGRQIDALKFINKFSFYKEPTFYFDYFNSIRKDINILKLNVNINLKQDKDTIFNYYDCALLDWEKDEDCVDLTPEEVKILIDKVLNV